jgi:hypothetical protein
VSDRELVRRSPRIALARFDEVEEVTAAWTGDVPCCSDSRVTTFTTIEVLKGHVDERFDDVIDRRAYRFKDEAGADFNGHADPDFWKRWLARQTNGDDCKMHPHFEVGATYVIFLDPPYHRRSFERIDRPDDRWLHRIKALVAEIAADEARASTRRQRANYAITAGALLLLALAAMARRSYTSLMAAISSPGADPGSTPPARD